MATTWIDIADSAVKIGLGAAIAGAVSLLAPFALFAKEVYVDKRQRRLRLLEEAVTSLETYLTYMSSRAAATSDYLKTHKSGKVPDHVKTRYERLLGEVDTRGAERNRATARLELLGHHDIADEIRDLADQVFAMNRAMFDAPDASDIQKRFEAIKPALASGRREILQKIGRFYEQEPELRKISKVDFDVH